MKEVIEKDGRIFPVADFGKALIALAFAAVRRLAAATAPPLLPASFSLFLQPAMPNIYTWRYRHETS
jgi:hypothetical protein